MAVATTGTTLRIAVAVAATITAIAPVATASTSETATSAKTAFAARGTIFAGFGFVDAHRATMELLVVQRGNGGLALLVIGHFNEAEAS